MATSKPSAKPQDSSSTVVDTAAAETTDAAITVPDYTTSPTWGQGGCYIINGAGDRVSAPSTTPTTPDQE